jgi:hypothetical protein
VGSSVDALLALSTAISLSTSLLVHAATHTHTLQVITSEIESHVEDNYTVIPGCGNFGDRCGIRTMGWRPPWDGGTRCWHKEFLFSLVLPDPRVISLYFATGCMGNPDRWRLDPIVHAIEALPHSLAPCAAHVILKGTFAIKEGGLLG